MATTSWNQLSERTRRLIVIGGAFEGALKAAAIFDLVKRPGDQVRGTKLRWAAAIVLINAVGAVPISYFAFGRRKA